MPRHPIRITPWMLAPCAALALLAGCATQSPRTAMSSQGASPTHRADSAYMATVERNARQRGFVLQWVNPPTRRVDRGE